MSQTTLSILALATAMLIAIGQIRWSMQTQNRLVDDELEVMASGVARHVLEFAASRAFDERTTPPQWALLGAPTSSADFDVSGDFGNVPTCNLADVVLNTVECDDIDDLNMDSTAWQVFPFIMESDTMNFEVNVLVFYVDDIDPEVQLSGASKSESKEIVVRVRSPLHVQQNRFKDGLVELRRVFTYDEDNEEARWQYYDSNLNP